MAYEFCQFIKKNFGIHFKKLLTTKPKIMKKLLKPLTLLVLTTSLASCVSIRSDKYVAIKSEDLKVSSAKKSKIFIDWGFRSINNSNPPEIVVDSVVSAQKKLFSEGIKESECCEIVSDKDEAEIIVTGKFHNETSQAGLYASIVTGLTLYVVPSWMNSKMRITVTVNKRKLTKDYDLKDSLFFAQWLPLVVVPIFTGNQIAVETEVNKNLYKTLLTQMKKDEFFGK